MSWKRIGLLAFVLVLIGLVGYAVHWVLDEVRTSRHQAAWLAGIDREVRFAPGPGPSPSIRYPGPGPADTRLGYHQLPQRIERLRERGYEVERQARLSARMLALDDQGLFVPYTEKTHAGLALDDCGARPLYRAHYPERFYPDFAAVPPLLVASLVRIENRELLDPPPTRNPAIEWDRLGKAVIDQLLRRVDESHGAGGASTLATQIEKFRHSSEGRTETAHQKLLQMASASLRAYLDGEDTTARRRRIALDYLNTVPLSAQPGFGEVNGIGDGLFAWYGRDFAEVNRLLAPGAPQSPARALAYKQALSLIVSERRPSYYLGADGARALRQLTDATLRHLAEAGVISPALRDAALPLALAPARRAAPQPQPVFNERKAATALRAHLQALLAVPHAYDLDRLDLSADTSLSLPVQKAASSILRSLDDPDGAKAAGLYGFRLLSPGDDTSRIVYSFTLYERGKGVNLLRAQTDSVDQPFDINEGARLDLGSTAKLRTLITYLEQVDALHREWSGLDPKQLQALKPKANDAIARWARDYLVGAQDRGLRPMLEAAMERSYSADPGEGFFTGGGLHHFVNFEASEDSQRFTVREALAQSVNLVFIRLMRDVVRHVMAADAASDAELLGDRDNPQRREYLARFADQEGRVFVIRFYRKLQGKSADEVEEILQQNIRVTPLRLASLFFGLEPGASDAQLEAFLRHWLPGNDADPAELRAKAGPERWGLADRGYLAGVHPLELWVAAWLRTHPKATLSETIAASAAQRQEVYGWLFKTRHKGAQDERIRTLLEQQAFVEIQRDWKRLGYPFDSLTPSYATALGASGDRPAALAELMGIVVNRGLRLPLARLPELRFGTGTPYETRLDYAPRPGARVLSPEITDVVREALLGVVDHGTASRLKGALKRPGGSGVEIGGKTGTGDHRFDVFGRGGRLISSRVVDRTATFVFLIDDRWFGTIVAYVHEPYAANYKFTSALPAQLLKAVLPSLQPLFDGTSCRPDPG
ncbi:MAG: transglycosylase domain-containing protein [Burkholderiales bacterium]|nr:transglycosylase domain-containing protein [Burkholderiales bacterium]